MQRMCIATITILVSLSFFTGCESHQARVDALQKEYDRLSQQFGKDCSADYLKMPPTLSPKCVDEDKKMKEVWDRLQAERAKQ